MQVVTCTIFAFVMALGHRRADAGHHWRQSSDWNDVPIQSPAQSQQQSRPVQLANPYHGSHSSAPTAPYGRSSYPSAAELGRGPSPSSSQSQYGPPAPPGRSTAQRPTPSSPHGQAAKVPKPPPGSTVTKITFTTAPAPQTYIRIPASLLQRAAASSGYGKNSTGGNEEPKSSGKSTIIIHQEPTSPKVLSNYTNVRPEAPSSPSTDVTETNESPETPEIPATVSSTAPVLSAPSSDYSVPSAPKTAHSSSYSVLGGPSDGGTQSSSSSSAAQVQYEPQPTGGVIPSAYNIQQLPSDSTPGTSTYILHQRPNPETYSDPASSANIETSAASSNSVPQILPAPATSSYSVLQRLPTPISSYQPSHVSSAPSRYSDPDPTSGYLASPKQQLYSQTAQPTPTYQAQYPNLSAFPARVPSTFKFPPPTPQSYSAPTLPVTREVAQSFTPTYTPTTFTYTSSSVSATPTISFTIPAQPPPQSSTAPKFLPYTAPPSKISNSGPKTISYGSSEQQSIYNSLPSTPPRSSPPPSPSYSSYSSRPENVEQAKSGNSQEQRHEGPLLSSYEGGSSSPQYYPGNYSPSHSSRGDNTQTSYNTETTNHNIITSPNPQSNPARLPSNYSNLPPNPPTQSFGMSPVNSLDSQSYIISSDPPNQNGGHQVVKFHQTTNGQGHDTHEYETTNGIRSQEQTSLSNSQGSIVKKGSYSWFAPDGKRYEVRYTADAFGFHPEGDHIPKNLPV